MKNISIFISIIILSVLGSLHPAKAEETSMQLNALTAPILYFQMGPEPLPVAEMMLRLDSEGQSIRDEFEKRRFLERKKNDFAKLIHGVESVNKFVIRVNAKLGNYDFDNARFPVEQIYRSMYFSFSNSSVGIQGPDFTASIMNSSDFLFVDIPVDEAESLTEKLGRSREIAIVMLLTPVDSGFKSIEVGGAQSLKRNVNFYADSARFLIPESNETFSLLAGVSEQPENFANRTLSEIVPDATNPWLVENNVDAVLARYSYLKSPEVLETILDYRLSVMDDCLSDHGYSDCKDLSTARVQFMNRCERIKQSEDECAIIRYIPYTNDELAAMNRHR